MRISQKNWKEAWTRVAAMYSKPKDKRDGVEFDVTSSGLCRAIEYVLCEMYKNTSLVFDFLYTERESDRHSGFSKAMAKFVGKQYFIKGDQGSSWWYPSSSYHDVWTPEYDTYRANAASMIAAMGVKDFLALGTPTPAVAKRAQKKSKRAKRAKRR
jgi:hypothetical protein